jgi:signal transduction histidine kinase
MPFGSFRACIAELRDISLQWKLGLLVLAGLLLLFGLFAWLGELMTEDTARAMAAERVSVARLTASFLDHQFGEQFQQLEWLASARNGSEPERWANLAQASAPVASSVFLVDNAGRVVWSEPQGVREQGQDLSAELYVQGPLVTGQRYASPAFPDPDTRRPTVVFSVPVRGADGALTGVLAASLDTTDSLFQVLVTASSELGTSGHAELVDQNLRLIASNELNHALWPAEHPTFYRPLLEQRTSAVGLTDPIGDEDPQDRGQRHIMAFIPLRNVPWGLGLGGSQSAFTALSERWRGYTLPLGGVALSIALFLVWVTRRRVVEPLRTLTQTSERIAGGDLATPVLASGDGELRVLAEAFDRMRSRLLAAHLAEIEVNRVKDDFLAIASHELRTPVAALSAMTQLQRTRLQRGQQVSQDEAFGQIHEQLERLARLVALLLDTSQIDAGKLALQKRSADLARLVADAARAVEVTHAGRHTVKVQGPASIPAIVDPVRMSQVITNLLDNAVKHSPDASPVDVQLSQPSPGTARLAVRDYGAGIRPAHQARIFDRFFQELGVDSPAGLGLGLYVSREIVELHAGRIQVESPPDGGTCFVVILPTGVP